MIEKILFIGWLVLQMVGLNTKGVAMYNTGDIYRIIQDALDANQIYCTDSKLGDGSEDTYETDTEFVSGNDAHLIATVKHQHFDYNRPYQENEHIETTKFRIKVEMIEWGENYVRKIKRIYRRIK